jgi:hypothetical protein
MKPKGNKRKAKQKRREKKYKKTKILAHGSLFGYNMQDAEDKEKNMNCYV